MFVKNDSKIIKIKNFLVLLKYLESYMKVNNPLNFNYKIIVIDNKCEVKNIRFISKRKIKRFITLKLDVVSIKVK